MFLFILLKLMKEEERRRMKCVDTGGSVAHCVGRWEEVEEKEEVVREITQSSLKPRNS